MQRVFLMLLTLFALYACSQAEVHKTNTIRPAMPVTRTEIPVPVTFQATIPIDVQALPLSTPGRADGHIALLLPLQSDRFGAAAQSVWQGFMTAAKLDPQAPPIRAYDSSDENVVTVYRQAIANGARAVVGPLTRNGVTALAEMHEFPVPTLVLNIPEAHDTRNLYFFGMAIEGEAKQIAQLARKQGMKQAIVVSANVPLARRLQFSFEEQWVASGGTVSREIEYTGDTMVFADITATPDSMVFFATDIEQSRTIRPYLPTNLAAYATSQLFVGNRDTLLNFDFDGIRFVDMPWLMQPDLPGVMVYPRASPPLATEQERLYALGIDAWRLVNTLMTGSTSLPLNGVTGLIRLNGHTFNREALPSVFVQGHAQSADAPVAQALPMFPDQFRNASSVEAAQPRP